MLLVILEGLDSPQRSWGAVLTSLDVFLSVLPTYSGVQQHPCSVL